MTKAKNYFNTILKEVKPAELVYWWILRLAMVYALFDTVINGSDYSASNPWTQIVANLVGMFAYEIIGLFPKNSKFRKMSPRFQNITALGFFLGSFGGAYLNLYYSLPMYDKILHALGTAEAVYIGYELVCATQLTLKKTCPKEIAVLCALGFGFILSCGWELFEFTYDQFFGGDAQHWNYQLALQAAGGDPNNIFSMFPFKDMALFEKRFPLMDTMSDMVLNFIGAFIMYGVLCFVPYRHRGKNNINDLIEKEQAQAANSTEKQNKA